MVFIQRKYKMVIIWILKKNFPSYLTENCRISGRTETLQAKSACIHACIHARIHAGDELVLEGPSRWCRQPALGSGASRAGPELLAGESGCVHITGLECSHLRVMFSEYTAECVKVTRTCELLGLAPGSLKLWRKVICRKSTLWKSELGWVFGPDSTIQEFVCYCLSQERDSKYFCWKVNRFVEVMNLFKKFWHAVLLLFFLTKETG